MSAALSIVEKAGGEVKPMGIVTDIRQAQERMGDARRSRIRCMDADGHLLGVISLSDIAQVETGDRAAQTMREITKREAA